MLIFILIRHQYVQVESRSLLPLMLDGPKSSE
jgi:hypothetical protein